MSASWRILFLHQVIIWVYPIWTILRRFMTTSFFLVSVLPIGPGEDMAFNLELVNYHSFCLICCVFFLIMLLKRSNHDVRVLYMNNIIIRQTERESRT